MNSSEPKGQSSSRSDRAACPSSRTSTLGDLLQTQIRRHEDLLQEHIELKNSFKACQFELVHSEEEVLSLRNTVKQQLKELEGLRTALQTSEAKFAKCKEVVDAKDCVCQRLKTEVSQLTQALANLQSEHHNEMQALEARFEGDSMSGSADQLLVARVSELEDKLEQIEAKRSSAGLSALTKPLFVRSEVFCTSPQLKSCKGTGEWKPTRFSENCSGIQSPNFSPLQSRPQEDTGSQFTVDLLESLTVKQMAKQSCFEEQRKYRGKKSGGVKRRVC
jgi:hypothetical protein